MTVLAGDIGGTKTTLGLFDQAHGPRDAITRITLPSRDYDTFEALCAEIMRSGSGPVTHAALGVAGPVSGHEAHTTNLPWTMDADRLAAEFGFQHVELFNDLVAVVYGVPHLSDAELHTLIPASGDPAGPIAILAPGTGLGQAFATREAGRLIALPSEGGHVDFAPVNNRQVRLLEYMRQTHEHVSYERVCSGIGIGDLYDFLEAEGEIPASSWVEERLEGAEDRTPIIVTSGQDADRPCPLCAATIDLFTEILGAKAGNIALAGMATGGVYLGGGIPPRMLAELAAGAFAEAFLAKGRLRPLMEAIPVRVILNPDTAFIGAASRGLAALEGSERDSIVGGAGD